MKNNKNLKSIFTFLAMMFIFNTYISVEAVDYKQEKAPAGSDSSQQKIDDDQLVADNFGPGPGV